MRSLTVFIAFLSFSLPISAATFILCNTTAEPVDCQVFLAGGIAVPVQLAVGESKAVNCGRDIEIAYASAEGPKRLRLEPYQAYIFLTKKKVGLELITAELAGKNPGDKDVPREPSAVKVVKVPVKLMADDADPRTKTVWAATLKKRLAEASAILKTQAGVEFEAVEADDWTAEGNPQSLATAFADFERQVKPEPASLAIGFTSRVYPVAKGVDTPFSTSRGMYAPFILIRETEPRNEPERTEVLVQALGRYLGAVASPDPLSAMRPKLGDGKAIHAKFHIGFDPLNLLAVNIVAEQYRKGPLPKLADWPPETQVRLARIYATLMLASPEEAMNDEVMALLERAGLRNPPPMAPPMVAEVKPADLPLPKKDRILNGEQEAMRKVLKAIVVKAEENARKPDRLKGDALTEAYVRSAADVAFNLEPEVRKKAFLVALGMGLDDSELVRNNPLFRDLWRAVESDDERKARTAVLGNPTLRHRRDWCQHFALSAALTGIAGVKIAEEIGHAKETLDMTRAGGSGFSFADLAADYAGVAFAEKVLASGESLNKVRAEFTVEKAMPKADDLPEGLTQAKFKEQFGSTSDERYKKQIEEIRKRIK